MAEYDGPLSPLPIEWRTEEALELKASISYQVGKVAANETTAKLLRTIAGELFINGQDDRARYLRNNLAPKFEREAKSCRQRQRDLENRLEEVLAATEEHGYR